MVDHQKVEDVVSVLDERAISGVPERMGFDCRIEKSVLRDASKLIKLLVLSIDGAYDSLMDGDTEAAIKFLEFLKR